jgi:hypothetical protein
MCSKAVSLFLPGSSLGFARSSRMLGGRDAKPEAAVAVRVICACPPFDRPGSIKWY